MKVTFDPLKSAKNERERGLAFSRVSDFDFTTADYRDDTRKAYPERRIVALGYLDDRLHSLCFTPMGGDIRVISFRKANKRERRYYEEEKQQTTDE